MSKRSRISEGLLWAAELNVTRATLRTLRSGSSNVFRKSPKIKQKKKRIYFFLITFLKKGGDNICSLKTKSLPMQFFSRGSIV